MYKSRALTGIVASVSTRESALCVFSLFAGRRGLSCDPSMGLQLRGTTVACRSVERDSAGSQIRGLDRIRENPGAACCTYRVRQRCAVDERPLRNSRLSLPPLQSWGWTADQGGPMVRRLTEGHPAARAAGDWTRGAGGAAPDAVSQRGARVSHNGHIPEEPKGKNRVGKAGVGVENFRDSDPSWLFCVCRAA